MPRTAALKESAPPRPLHERHRPEKTLLYRTIDRHYPEFLTYMAEQGKPLPHHVQKEFDEYLKCGRLEHGFIPGILSSTPSGPDFGCSNTFPTYLSASTVQYLPQRAAGRIQL